MWMKSELNALILVLIAAQALKLTSEYKDLRDKRSPGWRVHLSIGTGETKWLLM
jgi:hypothetical protein